MKSKIFTKRMFLLELSEEELSIIAGALYCANNEDIKCFVDKYKYPCSGYSFDEVAESQEKLSEEINRLIENK
jgi:hypothetical protein